VILMDQTNVTVTSVMKATPWNPSHRRVKVSYRATSG